MEDESKKTGIIYCRVSSTEQIQGTSLAMQERLCREYAQRENIDIITDPFIEEGESAKTANRTQFQKALAFCSNKKQPVDFFIVHKIDRFARNQYDHETTQAFLRKFGTKLRSVTEHIDDTPVGKAMEGMLSVFAEFDNNVRSARSKSGMEERVKAGVWVWAAPIGYKRLRQGGNLIIDEDKAPYVRLAFSEWQKGTYSYKTLSEFLYDRGFRTNSGKKPYPQAIEKIIRNPNYAGIIRAFGLEVKATFPAIIDETIFLQCQPGVRRPVGHTARIWENPDFPLRKFTICKVCNTSITGSHSKGRAKSYPYYHHQKQGCEIAHSIAKSTFEDGFVELLQRVSPKHKQYEKVFKAIVMDVWQSNYKKLDADNAQLRKEIESLEQQRQQVFDLHRAGTYSDADFIEQKGRISLTIEQKKILLDEKRVEEFNMEEALNFCFELVRNSGKTWAGLNEEPALRGRFQKMVFPNKVTFDGEKFDTTKMSIVYEINQTAGASSSSVVRREGFEPS